MKLIFPNMIEAIGTIFAINRFLRGQIKFEDPEETIAITEAFGMVALSDSGKDGPIMAVSIDELDDTNPHPETIRSQIIPQLLLSKYDFVYHIFDANVIDVTEADRKKHAMELIALGELSACVDQIESVIGVLYSAEKIVAKSIASIQDCVAFYRKNVNNEFPAWKLPNDISALWQLVEDHKITLSTQPHTERMTQAMENINWN